MKIEKVGIPIDNPISQATRDQLYHNLMKVCKKTLGNNFMGELEWETKDGPLQEKETKTQS